MTTGVVEFSYPAFIAQYPLLSSVTSPVATAAFNQITGSGMADNTPCSVISDVAQRAVLLNMATAHQLVLNGAVNPAQAGSVGRVSSASQGSVSVSTEYQVKGGSTAAWWNQTPYGAEYYAATLRFRAGFYVPPVAIQPTLPFYGRAGLGIRRGGW